MPYLPDAFAEIREVEASVGRRSRATERAAMLTPADAARINGIAEAYPHLSPDSLMALGRAGYDWRSPEVTQVADIEGQRLLHDHPGGRQYGAPGMTPGMRREEQANRRNRPTPTWQPQTGNPEAVAAWHEALGAGLVTQGVLTAPTGPDAQRLTETYQDILDRLTLAGESVPVMRMDGDKWTAAIARRRASPSAAAQFHAGYRESIQQRQHVDFETLWREGFGEPEGETSGGGRFGSSASGVAGAVPGLGEAQQVARGASETYRGQLGSGGVAAAGVTGLRQALQGAFAGMDYGVQELQGQVRNLYGVTHGKDVDFWEAQSDLGIMATTSIDDMGEGFFVDQESEVAQERRRREAERGQIGGHNVTLGRWVADAAPFATDSKPSLILSGLVDLGVQVYGDPSAYVLGKAGEANEARKLFQARDLAGEEDAGIVRGLRNIINGPTKDHWLTTATAHDRLEWISHVHSPYEMYLGLNRKVNLDLVTRLADEANTPEDALRILEPELGTRIREVGTVTMPGMGGNPMAPRPTQMPLRGPIDAYDKDIVGRELEAWLHNAGATPTEIAPIFDAVARSETPVELNAAIRDAMRSGDGVLAREGIPARLRSRFVRLQENAHTEASQTYRAAMTEQTPTYNSLVADGVPVHDAGANLYVEHAPRYITLPDARDIRRARSRFSRLLARADTGELRLPFATAEFITNEIWKPVQLATRIAWPIRVIGEEQIRMAAAGYDSMFRHPASFISWRIGRRGATDIAEDLFTESNQFKNVLTQSHGGWIDRAIATPHKTTYRLDNLHEREQFVESWASEIMRNHGDPVAQYVARAPGLDDAKAWFTRGGGNLYRGDLALAHPGKFDTLPQADAYMEIVAQRGRRATGGDAVLSDVLRTGNFNGKPIYNGRVFDKDFLAYLDSHADEFGPESVIGDVVDVGLGGTRDRVFRRLDAVTDQMFAHLMSNRTNNLSRSPTFRQEYWREAERLVAFGDEDAKAIIVAASEKANLSKRQLKRIRSTVARGDLSAEEIDLIAKGEGLDKTKELLYDLTRKGRRMDAMRLVMPFGEAWSEVMTRWFGMPALKLGESKGLIWKNPKTIRRFQQLVQGARGEQFGEVMGAPEGEGFFWTNGFGEEVFIYPGTQFLTEHTIGVPVPLTGRVQGLSMFGTVIPGLGPAAQIPVGWFLSSKPGPQGFKDFLSNIEGIELPLGLGTVEEQILPFGAVGSEDQGDIGNLWGQVPPWIRNMAQSVSEGDLDEKAYASTVMDTAAYLRSTGRYGDSVADQQRLLEDAQDSARELYFIRAMTGMAAPASPDFEFMVENNRGDLLRLAALRDEYFDLLEGPNGDPRTASATFLDKYGPEISAIVSTPQTTSSVIGTPMTKDGVDWVLANPGVEDRLPYTYGMFAPEGGGDDFSIYRRELRLGERVRLPPKTWIRLLNNTKGNMIWGQAQDQIQGSPNASEAQWLRDIADQLREEYPGWQDTTGRLEGSSTQTLIAELERAVDDPAVRNSDAAAGLRLYLQARDQAMEAAHEAGVQGFQTADRMESTRMWLNGVATAIMREHPDFEPMWTFVFSRETQVEE